MADRQRIIQLYPEREAPSRWDGTLAPDPAASPRHWTGPHIESVIAQMDKDLGPVSEAEYQVREG